MTLRFFRFKYQRLQYQFCGLLLLALCLVAAPQVWAQDGARPASNASPSQQEAIFTLFDRLEKSVEARTPNSLAYFGALEVAHDFPVIAMRSNLTHIAVAPTGALVRQRYQITGAADAASTPLVLAEGTQEVWLNRIRDTFSFSQQRWSPPADAVVALAQAAREEWEKTPPKTSRGSLLHLVATRRGGRWIALRRSRWDGNLFDDAALGRLAQRQSMPAGYALDPRWLRAQMASTPQDEPGTAHFILQRGMAGWIGIGMAWENDHRLSSEADSVVETQRRTILSDSYLLPTAHRELGISLARIGLYAEADDELSISEALEPGSVGPALLAQVTKERVRDPENLAVTQLDNEARVGLDPNHPSYVVSALARDYNREPTILRALRLGMEYSRLGEESRAQSWLGAARTLAAEGQMRYLSQTDSAWVKVLSDHLQERGKLAQYKPPVIIRSPLFTLRCWPNDKAAVQVLAALENAQHTVYADFNIPMGNTEILLWRSQPEFQQYVTRFSQQGNSEFVAALTLTKLITTQKGPVVLGEEINVFTDPRQAVFSTVAHEYGHVAVRQLSKGRLVPTWFNEGIATSVEGGYDGYIERLRAAARANSLLTMDEMLDWNVDGQRAFLAYSQANSIIDYIVAKWGKNAVIQILQLIGADQRPEDAFQTALGISQQELWRRWAQEGIK